MRDNEKTIKLTVVHVGSGGNSGEYFYSFAPDIIHVEHPHVTMSFVLDDDTASNFVIRDFVSTDARYQLHRPKFDENRRRVTVLNENTQRQLIYVGVLVHDKLRDKLIICDPQVINSPEDPD